MFKLYQGQIPTSGLHFPSFVLAQAPADSHVAFFTSFTFALRVSAGSQRETTKSMPAWPFPHNRNSLIIGMGLSPSDLKIGRWE